MSPSDFNRRGLYFEEFEVGQRIASTARTVTEADVTSFAGLSGDYTAIHTDAVYAQQTPYGQRIAHGLLGLSIASGLAVRTGFIEGTVIAFREINSWKYRLPIFFGDTIHVDIEIVGTKSLPRIGGGSVEIELDVKNQEEKTVMKGRWTVLVQARPEP